jgi:hypothetical protein
MCIGTGLPSAEMLLNPRAGASFQREVLHRPGDLAVLDEERPVARHLVVLPVLADYLAASWAWPRWYATCAVRLSRIASRFRSGFAAKS